MGTNNLARDSPEQICEKMAALIDIIKARNRSCKILVSGMIMRPQDELTDVKYTRKGDPSLATKRRDANTLIDGMVREKGAFLMKTWR